MEDTKTMKFSIGRVEQETGISREALRKWEERYGFPVPSRDGAGEREYCDEDVVRLRLIKALMNTGLRPSFVVPLPMSKLLELKLAQQGACITDADDDTGEVLAALKANDLAALAALLQKHLIRLGFLDFVVFSVSRWNRAVGEAWQRGELTIYQEHIYTEQIRKFVLFALEVAKPKIKRKSALLATPTGEQHSLGLLMVQCLLTLAGYECHYLGTQMPSSEIVAASLAFKVDLVAISISITFPKKSAAAMVQNLRDALPLTTSIWIGGDGAQSVRRRIPGVRFFKSIDQAKSVLNLDR